VEVVEVATCNWACVSTHPVLCTTHFSFAELQGLLCIGALHTDRQSVTQSQADINRYLCSAVVFSLF
jgi:hypothetical protein